MKWQASAPSNIALIKYMGKIPNQGNASTNSSLSYSLDHLRTFVELESNVDGGPDRWGPLVLDGLKTIPISPSGQIRFLKHLAFLKSQWHFQGTFTVRSNNNFPSDCGLASSASSFAALTQCAYLAIRDQLREATQAERMDLSVSQLSELSRQGSGSSCRSFFSPWGLWQNAGASAIDLPINNLHHQAIIISGDQKKVSSSEAHQRVSSSLLSQDRVGRAETRLGALINAITNNDWKSSYEIIWSEFWDMHALFETSNPSFGYMSAGSMMVLDLVRRIWHSQNDGPWATMDAGPNVHLLYRQDQLTLAKQIESELKPSFQIISHYV